MFVNKGFNKAEKDYTAVVDRYSNAVSQAKTLVENIQGHIQARSDWNLEYYEDAKEQYESNRESHKESDWVSELQPIADEMICYAETMIERCEEFILAEKLEEEGKEEDAETARNLAPTPSKECEFDDEE
jgi:hypothetical protein